MKNANIFPLAVLSALMALAGAADEAVFPLSAAVGDLSSAADWGRDRIPGTDAALRFGAGYKTQTVTAKADVEFGSIRVNAECGTVVFDMRDEVTGGAPRRIRINGAGNLGNLWYPSLRLLGGEWAFSGSVGVWNGSYVTPKGGRVTIGDGAVVTCSTLYGGYNDMGGGGFTVAGEGTVVTARQVQASYYNGSNNRCTIEDGAQVCINGSGNGVFQTDAGNGSDNVLSVRNGAKLRKLSGATNYCGVQGSRNALVVEGGSEATLGSTTYLGYSDGSGADAAFSNRFEAVGANSKLSLGSVYLGRGANAGNTIEARDGAVVTGAVTYLQGAGNGFVVSNATMVWTSSGVACQPSSTNGFVRLQGETPRFELQTDGKTGNYAFRNGFRLVFDLPRNGYPDGHVPVELIRWGTLDETVEVDVNGLDGFALGLREKGRRRATCVLLRTGASGIGGSGVTSNMVARWNARLPEGVRLSWKGAKELVLDVEIPPPESFSAVQSNAADGIYAIGSEATVTFSVTGDLPNFARPFVADVYDYLGRLVTNVAVTIVTDGHGNGSGTGRLPTDRFGFFRVQPSTDYFPPLPKVGTRPAGQITYGVTLDPADRIRPTEDEAFQGLHGGVGEEGRWVGAHAGFNGGFATEAEYVAWTNRPAEARWLSYGAQNVVPNNMDGVIDRFSAKSQAWIRAHAGGGDGGIGWNCFTNAEAFEVYCELLDFRTDDYMNRPRNPCTRFYEIFWEPNITAGNGLIADCAKIARAELRKRDPEAQIALPTFYSTSLISTYRDVFNRGILDDADCFSAHAYAIDFPPEPNGWLEDLRIIRRLMADHGRGDLPVIFTETGYQTEATLAGERLQADGHVRIHLMALGEGVRFHNPFYGCDYGGDLDDHPEGDYGLAYNLDYPNPRFGPKHISPRPALMAICGFSMLFDGWRPLRCHESFGATVMGYSYTNRTGDVRLALWDYGKGPSRLALPVGRARIEVADMMGNRSWRETEDGVLDLELDASPVYVLSPDRAAVDAFAADCDAHAFYEHADGLEFPDLDGSHDIASSAAWGEHDAARASTRLHFVKTGVYTASRDCSVGGIFIRPHRVATSDDERVVFDLTAHRPTVSLTGDNASVGSGGTMETHGGVDIYRARNAAFRGGTWDFRGNQRYNCGAYDNRGYNGKHDIRLELTDGCVWTNVASSRMTFASHGNNRWTLDGASTMHFSGDFAITQHGGDFDNRLTVRNGSRFLVSGVFESDTGYDGTTSNRVVVSGAGSLLRVCGAGSAFAKQSCGNVFLVEDGAELDVSTPSYLYFGRMGAAKDNLLHARAGGRLRFSTLYWGGSRNELRLEGGSAADVYILYLNGGDNVLRITNSTLRIARIFDASGATRGVVSIAGAEGRVLFDLANSWDSVQLGTNLTVRLEVPSGGYANGTVPLAAARGQIRGELHLELRGVGRRLAEVRRAGVESETVTLVSAPNGCPALTDELVSEVNATLPEGAAAVREGTTALKLLLNASSGEGPEYPGGDVTATVSPYTGVYDGTVHALDLAYGKPAGAGEVSVGYSCEADGDYVPLEEFSALRNATPDGPVTVYVRVSAPQCRPTTVSTTVEIRPRPVTLVAGSAQRPYGQVALTCGAWSVKDGGETADYGFVGDEGIASLSMTADSRQAGVGSCPNVIDVASLVARAGTDLSNYDIACEPGTLTVTTGPGVKVTATDYAGTYDGAAHTVGVFVTKPAGSDAAEIGYSLSAEGPFVPLAEFARQKDVTKEGPVRVYVRVTVPNYEPTTVSATVTIRPAPVVVRAGSGEKAYDRTPLAVPDYTASGFVGEDGIASLSMAGGAGLTVPGTRPNAVDEASVTFTEGTDPGNYDITYVAGELTVTPGMGVGSVDTFEYEREGATAGSLANWQGDRANVVLESYEPPTPPGNVTPLTTHTRVLDATEGDAVRTIPEELVEKEKVDVMVCVRRPLVDLKPLDEDIQLQVASDRRGRLCLWHLYEEKGAWTRGWTPLSEVAYADGAWVRLGVEFDYAGNPSGDAFAKVTVNGSCQPTARGVRSPTDTRAYGPWHYLAKNRLTGGASAPRELAFGGAKVDDLMLARRSVAPEHEGSTSADGVPFAWFDAAGLPRDAQAAAPFIPGYTLGDAYDAGVDPLSDRPLEVLDLTLADGLLRLEINGYRGERPSAYRMLYSPTPDFGACSELGASDGKFTGDAATRSTVWEGVPPASAAGGFYKVRAVR